MDENIEVVINNEFDYSNIIPDVDSISYLIQYCDNVYRQMMKIYGDDEKKNEQLKYEYKNYLYKNNFSKLEIYIREKTHNNITCNNYDMFADAAKNGQLKNVDSMEIRMDLNYVRGTNNNLIIHENSYIVIFKPYNIIFARKSNHNENYMNQVEYMINEILKKFKTENSIFCSK